MLKVAKPKGLQLTENAVSLAVHTGHSAVTRHINTAKELMTLDIRAQWNLTIQSISILGVSASILYRLRQIG
jgi:hypothetical protein